MLRRAALLLPLVLAACAPEPAAIELDERRVQLFARLGEFRAVEGFPGDSARFLRLTQDPDRNEAYGRLRLRVPPTSRLRVPRLRVPAGARLELAVGLGWRDELVPDEGSAKPWPTAPVERYGGEFVVLWRTDEDLPAVELGRRALELPVERAGVREEWVLDLSELAGLVGRLDLVVTRTLGPVDLLVFPEWWSPVLVAPMDAEHPFGPDLGRVRERVVTDLLAEAAEARVFTDGVLRGRVGEALPAVELGQGLDGGEPVSVPLAAVRSHFETGQTLDIARGAPMPALALADSAEVRWPAVESSGGPGRELRFALGLERSLRGLAGAGIGLSVRRGEESLEETHLASDGPELDGGWSPDFRLPLPGGDVPETIAITLELTPADEPLRGAWEELDEDGRTVRRAAEFDRPWVGIGRPRIVEQRLVAPQPFGDRDGPSVLVICAETLRADELSPWGGSGTPHLERWARRGLVFRQAYSPSSWTLPSVVSFLTGLAPGVHGAMTGESDQIGDWCTTIAEAAHWEGIRTGAFVSNALLRRSAGFAEGFDTFVPASTANARQLLDLFGDWLSERPDQRFFAYVHLFDPHTPYNAPGEHRDGDVPVELADRSYGEEVETVRRRKVESHVLTTEDESLRYLRARYRGEVRFLDEELGRLLDGLERSGALENTLVAFLSDHGEEFGEHHWYGHGNNLYVESTRVPLVLWGAGVRPGVVEEPVETLSLTPRLAEVLDLEAWSAELRRSRPALPLQPLRGLSAPVWIASDKGVDLDDPSTDFLAEPAKLDPRPIRALVMDGRKAILRLSRAPEAATEEDVREVLEAFELYDLEADPDERMPISRDFADLPADMARILYAELAAELEAPKHMVDERITDQMRGVLEGLGYLEGPDPEDE